MTSDIVNDRGEHGSEGARALVRQNRDVVKSGIDAAIYGVKQIVHEFRAQAQG